MAPQFRYSYLTLVWCVCWWLFCRVNVKQNKAYPFFVSWKQIPPNTTAEVWTITTQKRKNENIMIINTCSTVYCVSEGHKILIQEYRNYPFAIKWIVGLLPCDEPHCAGFSLFLRNLALVSKSLDACSEIRCDILLTQQRSSQWNWSRSNKNQWRRDLSHKRAERLSQRLSAAVCEEKSLHTDTSSFFILVVCITFNQLFPSPAGCTVDCLL